MPSADAFLAELTQKSQNSLDRLFGAYTGLLASERLELVDIMKIETKSVLEQTEAAALWMTDTDDLDFKMALAEACGSGARRFDLLRGRLSALGVDPASFDPLVLGYSKLFAFLRSLQTIEERACAGAMTLHRHALARHAHVAALATERGDAETAHLYGEVLPREEQRLIDAGTKALLLAASGEESQARARRASFRVIELLGEMLDPTLVRKFLTRSAKKL